MPAPLAPLVGFALGVLFSWAAGQEHTHNSGALLATRSCVITVLFAFVVFGPFAGYFMAFAPDWSMAYLVDTRRVPTALWLLSVLLDIASVVAGFVVGARQAQRRHLMVLLPWMTVPLALAAVLVAAFSRQLSVFGRYVEVKRNFGVVPLAGSPLGHAILWMFACLLGAVVWTLRELRRSGVPARNG